MRFIKRLVKKKFPGLISVVRDFKRRRDRLIIGLLHWRDARLNSVHMNWVDRRGLDQTEAELIFQFHKLEKGMCMPKPKRFFGLDAIHKTLELVQEWEIRKGDLSRPAYLGAIEAVRAYGRYVEVFPPPSPIAEVLLPKLESFLMSRTEEHAQYSTPIPLPERPEMAGQMFKQLMLARRSVRDYSPQAVSAELIAECVEVAGFSPSACNRQPWRVHSYVKPEQIKELLKFQNGNAGFGHLLKNLLIITADRASFFDATERNEPFIDGGLFAMSLILALQSQGVSSCCLNWCVGEVADQNAHRVGDIPEQEVIIMYMAVGYAAESVQVPRSPRKAVDSVLVGH